MYEAVKVYIPKETYEKLKRSLVVKDQGMPIKIDLKNYGNDILLLTPGPIIKMRNARTEGKKSIILRFSGKQVRADVKLEGGFLSTIIAYTIDWFGKWSDWWIS